MVLIKCRALLDTCTDWTFLCSFSFTFLHLFLPGLPKSLLSTVFGSCPKHSIQSPVWAPTCDDSKMETHKIYSEGKINVTQGEFFFPVYQDIITGYTCLSKRVKVFQTGISDLKSLQTLSKDLMLL